MKASETPPSPLRHWSALAPLAMSLAALLLVLVYGLIIRPGPQADEGTAAHVYQLLMVAQFPVVVYFAILWLPRRWRSALLILLLQAVAWLTSLGALYLFENAGA